LNLSSLTSEASSKGRTTVSKTDYAGSIPAASNHVILSYIVLSFLSNRKTTLGGLKMPIQKVWSAFTSINLSTVPDRSGIYELGDIRGEIVYIGSGDSARGVRGRLYFHKKYKPKSVRYFRFLLTSLFESPIALEERHCTLFKSKYGRLPRLQKRMPRGYLPFW
jgi:hypothetical protein